MTGQYSAIIGHTPTASQTAFHTSGPNPTIKSPIKIFRSISTLWALWPNIHAKPAHDPTIIDPGLAAPLTKETNLLIPSEPIMLPAANEFTGVVEIMIATYKQVAPILT
jgi:hypothetical protein